MTTPKEKIINALETINVINPDSEFELIEKNRLHESPPMLEIEVKIKDKTVIQEMFQFQQVPSTQDLPYIWENLWEIALDSVTIEGICRMSEKSAPLV